MDYFVRIRLVFTGFITIIISFLKKKKMSFLSNYADQFMEVIELPGETAFETATKEMVSSFTESAVLAQKIQALSDAGDDEVLDVSKSLTGLALKFNKAFPDLDEDQQAEVNVLVAGIVTGDNEGISEEWFALVLKNIHKGQKFAKEATLLLETPVE